MKPVCFKRVFTNNNGYDKYESIPYLKSLALTVQDFLYTKKAENNDVDFNMSKHIKLWDFMNLAVYFISAASSDFGKSSIQSYINDIQQRIDRDYPLYKERVEVIHDGKNLLVSCASFELLISILWTTYIYVKFYYELSGDEQYKRATDMIKEIMLEKNRYSVSHFNTLHPIKDTKGALMFMAKNLATHGVGKTQKKTTETKDSATIAQLQNRIAELEAENKALKDKMEKLKASKDGDKLIEEIKRLKEEKENIIVNMLTPIFCGMESNARDFLRKIQGVTDQEVTSLVAELVNNRKISIKSYRRDLWRILHGTNLYGATESNWNLVIKPQIKQTKQ